MKPIKWKKRNENDWYCMSRAVIFNIEPCYGVTKYICQNDGKNKTAFSYIIGWLPGTLICQVGGEITKAWYMS